MAGGGADPPHSLKIKMGNWGLFFCLPVPCDSTNPQGQSDNQKLHTHTSLIKDAYTL